MEPVEYGRPRMFRVSSVLPAVLRKRGLQEHASSSCLVTVAAEWLERVLPQVTGQAKPLSIRDGQLVIVCDHSIAAQECRQVSEEFFAYLRQNLPDIPLSGIRIVRSGALERK